MEMWDNLQLGSLGQANQELGTGSEFGGEAAQTGKSQPAPYAHRYNVANRNS